MTTRSALDDMIEHSSLLKGLEIEFNEGKTSFAVFSPKRVHRYLLHRSLEGGSQGTLCFVMLNPSKAGAHRADPTWRRCIGLAKERNFKAVMAVNLFAGIATDPDELLEHDEPIGVRNNHFLLGAANFIRKHPGILCVAWGAIKIAKKPGRRFLSECDEIGLQPYCLGLAKGGAPRHPLYVNGNVELEQFHG